MELPSGGCLMPVSCMIPCSQNCGQQSVSTCHQEYRAGRSRRLSIFKPCSSTLWLMPGVLRHRFQAEAESYCSSSTLVWMPSRGGARKRAAQE